MHIVEIKIKIAFLLGAVSWIMHLKHMSRLHLQETHGTGRGVISHMSFAYSWMVLSLLNIGDPAVFKIDIFVHLCMFETTNKFLSISLSKNNWKLFHICGNTKNHKRVNFGKRFWQFLHSTRIYHGWDIGLWKHWLDSVDCNYVLKYSTSITHTPMIVYHEIDNLSILWAKQTWARLLLCHLDLGEQIEKQSLLEGEVQGDSDKSFPRWLVPSSNLGPVLLFTHQPIF